MKKIAKKLILKILIGVMCLSIVCFIVLHLTPKPLFKVAKIIPVEANLTKPDNYSMIEAKTKVEKNIVYSKDYSNSSLDIYSPIHSKKKLPVILFVHGGGFFKGEKEMAKYFGPTISNGEYTFISINYDLVPNITVFDQVKQINEAIKYIVDNAETFSIDVNHINLSGSSAGGFLALQLLSAYYDKNYASGLNIDLVENIRFNSVLLYSSVYDLSIFQSYNDNFIVSYLLSKMGWGLTGKKNWKNDSDLGALLNLNVHINKNFPPVFITDGNTNTFTDQAKRYSDELSKIGVPIQTLFFSSKEKIGHGYQLNMCTNASKEAINKSLDFLESYNE
ncbi:hypothetical protein A5881_003875 [Enterococcus termitis]